MCAINKSSLLTALGILSMLACGSVVAATEPDISGKYVCSYNDPLSNPRDGNENIVIKKMGDNYKISVLAVDSVTPYFIGWGLFNKNISNSVAFQYWQQKSPQYTNLIVFQTQEDGSLDGLFAPSNTQKVGTIKCTKST